MRLLAVGNLYPPHHEGGYELIWRAAVEHLRARGHELRVLTSDRRIPHPTAPEDPGVHRELRWYWREHRFPRMSLGQRIALERHNAAVLARHLREHAPEVVTWWAMGGMSLSLVERVRRAGMPAVGFVIDDWMVYGPRTDGWLRLAGRRWVPAGALERATGLPARWDPGSAARWMFVSEATRRAALSRWALPDTGIAHAGVEAGFLRARPRPAGEWRYRLLHAGRLDPRKGIDTALDALARLPAHATLELAGSGEEGYRETLRGQVARLGLGGRVRFLGACSRERLIELYDAADAVLFPVRWEEPWGLVPLEAMARARPVLATGTGGSAEYLEHERNCLLFARGDAGGLAGALVRLGEDAALRERLAGGGLETARQHTDQHFHVQVEEAILAARG